MREGLSVAWIGIAVGIAGAAALTRLLSGLLFQVSTFDPVTFAIGAAAVILIAVLASTVPARRAASLARSMRCEMSEAGPLDGIAANLT